MSDVNRLPEQDNRDTRPLAQDKRLNIAPVRRPHVLDDRVPKAIRFITSSLDKVFTVEVQPMMVVGRRNSLKDMDVAVDLSSQNAYEMGVSRFHAMIVTLGNRVTIKDLNSLNGTQLNGKAMTPSQDYLLEHGDKVTFGELTFIVAFVH